MVLADRDLAAAEAAVAELGPEHLAHRADISAEAEVRDMVDAAFMRCGRIDVLVNNAGITDGARPTLDQSYETWERTIAINGGGTFLCRRLRRG